MISPPTRPAAVPAAGAAPVAVAAPVPPPTAGYADPSARRRRLLIGDLVGTAAIAGGVAVVALWVSGGGIQSLVGAAGWWTGVGRLSGLIASYLLLVQVLMMARIPWLERIWGQDGLARKHRWVGFGSFHLMLVHVVAITLGYAASARTGVWRELWILVTVYPGMLLATAGTACLVAVVVTSVRAARRRLRYESWHLIHLYAYLGVALALPHQLWTGADFTASGAATVFWWTLWAAAATALLWYRVGVPVARNLRHRLVVEAVVREAPEVVSVWMTGRRLDRLGMQAGQFCQWRFLGPGWTRANPFTVSAMPGDHRLRITLRVTGDGTRRIAGLRPGTAVLIEGPFGGMTTARRTRRDVLLIAAGVGVTTMRGLAEDLAVEAASAESGHLRAPSVVLLHRIRRPADALFAPEFVALAARADLRIRALVGSRSAVSGWWGGEKSVDPAWELRKWVPDLTNREIYLCGPADWMSQVQRTLRDLRVPAAAIHAEEFAW